MKLTSAFLWWCALTLAASPFALADAVLQQNRHTVNLSPYVQVLEDPSARLEVKDVASPDSAHLFVQPAMFGDALNLGLTQKIHWIAIRLKKQSGVDQEWILDLPIQAILRADAYLVTAAGNQETADPVLLPRLEGYRHHAWPLRLSSETATLYLRVQSSGSLTLPLQLQSAASFMREEQNDLFLQALYFGALLILFIYSLAFGWVNGEKNYGLFAGFLGFVGMALFLGNGLANQWPWWAQERWRSGIESVCYAISGALALAFTRHFTGPLGTWLDHALKAFKNLYLLLAFAWIFNTATGDAMTWLDDTMLVLTVLSVALIFVLLSKSIQLSGHHFLYFKIAWLSIALGALFASLRALGFLPSNSLSLYAMQIAIGIAAIFFSLAIFIQVHQQRKARENALKQSAEDRQKLIEHLQQSEQRLEKTVALRTQELNEALVSEKRMREQYVRFGAMISHEFRNPLGVIETQIAVLERELAAGIDRVGKRVGSVRAATQRLALLFEKWLQSDRLNNARDRLERKPLALDAWLRDIVERCHAYHFNHEIRMLPHAPLGTANLDESLMRIALLNLIDNACKYSPAQTLVSIQASIKDDMLCISVSDQGPGVPAPLRLRVFEEYFRVDPDTPVQGVGLGLPFVKKIIDLHGGSVWVTDAFEGSGACFSLRVPVHNGLA